MIGSFTAGDSERGEVWRAIFSSFVAQSLAVVTSSGWGSIGGLTSAGGSSQMTDELDSTLQLLFSLYFVVYC